MTVTTNTIHHHVISSFRLSFDTSQMPLSARKIPIPPVSLIEYRKNQTIQTARRRILNLAKSDSSTDDGESSPPATRSVSPTLVPAASHLPKVPVRKRQRVVYSSDEGDDAEETIKGPETCKLFSFSASRYSSYTMSSADSLTVALIAFVTGNPNCTSTAAELREILKDQDIDLDGMDDLVVADFKGLTAIQVGLRPKLYRFLAGVRESTTAA